MCVCVCVCVEGGGGGGEGGGGGGGVDCHHIFWPFSFAVQLSSFACLFTDGAMKYNVDVCFSPPPPPSSTSPPPLLSIITL